MSIGSVLFCGMNLLVVTEFVVSGTQCNGVFTLPDTETDTETIKMCCIELCVRVHISQRQTSMQICIVFYVNLSVCGLSGFLSWCLAMQTHHNMVLFPLSLKDNMVDGTFFVTRNLEPLKYYFTVIFTLLKFTSSNCEEQSSHTSSVTATLYAFSKTFMTTLHLQEENIPVGCVPPV